MFELDQITFWTFCVAAVNLTVFSFSTVVVAGVTDNVTNFTVTTVGFTDKFPASSNAFT